MTSTRSTMRSPLTLSLCLGLRLAGALGALSAAALADACYLGAGGGVSQLDNRIEAFEHTR